MRSTANKNFKVLSYVPETKDFTFLDGGWAVEWRTYTASYVDSPGGETKHARGTVLAVFKKLPDGSWKIFRALGPWSQGLPPKPVASDVKRPASATCPKGCVFIIEVPLAAEKAVAQAVS